MRLSPHPTGAVAGSNAPGGDALAGKPENAARVRTTGCIEAT
jgi:hypothetical protein